jgi:AbiV family abortive infection protein
MKENSPNAVDYNIERVQRYARGAQLIFSNAEALYNEAQTLGQSGAFARATVLHQISMEECAKIDTLGAAATSMLMGHDVDETRIANAFRDHKAKNHVNAYNATTTEEELAARARGDWQASSDAFKKFQHQFHVEVNTIKNAGLYVDFKEGEFTAPKDAISEAMAVAFMHLNADFLLRSENFVRLLRGMGTQPNLYADLVKRFSDRAEALRGVGDADPEHVTNILMEEMFADYAIKMP